jgi:DNA-binding transcriptional LysR family regulator
MELRQLRQVVMLAETLNFTRAAERLHMAQPPLSASIRKLEEELGVLLFDRLPGGLRPTSVGEAVLREARLALFHADQVRRTAKEGAAGTTGLLRLGFTGSSTYEMMPRLLQAYRAAYPKVSIEVYESNTSELLRQIESQALDVALVAYPALDGTTAHITLLRHVRLMVAVRADSPLAHREEVTLADLAEEPFIIHSRTQASHMHATILHAFHQAGVQPQVVQQAVQVNSMLGLVEAGMGVAVVPEVVAGHVSERVKLLRLAGPGSQTNLGLGIAALPDAQTPTARNFLALAIEVLGQPAAG